MEQGSTPDGIERDGIELVRDFVNTWDSDDGEELATPAAVRTWFSERGILAASARVSADDRARTVALREAIRALLLRNNEVDVDAQPQALGQVARRARLELAFAADGTPSLEPRAGGVDGALGRIVAAIAAAHGDGSWSRLKACRADDCRWAFVDHARNRSRSWCSMRSCGNRAKARAFRDRHGAQ